MNNKVYHLNKRNKKCTFTCIHIFVCLYYRFTFYILDLHLVSSQYASTLLSKPHGSRIPKPLKEVLAGAPSDAIDLVEKLLVFSPDKRLTAEEALKHPYVARWEAKGGFYKWYILSLVWFLWWRCRIMLYIEMSTNFTVSDKIWFAG